MGDPKAWANDPAALQALVGERIKGIFMDDLKTFLITEAGDAIWFGAPESPVSFGWEDAGSIQRRLDVKRAALISTKRKLSEILRLAGEGDDNGG